VPDPTVASFTHNENPTGGPHTVTYPSGLQSGDLIMGVVEFDNSPNPAFPAGWVNLVYRQNGSACVLIVKYKVSDGTESGTFTLTAGSSDESCTWVARIIDWNPALTILANTSFGGPNKNPDPDPLTVSPAYNFWIAVAGNDGTDAWAASPFPANFPDNRYQNHTWASLAVATLTLEATTVNPDTFAGTINHLWDCATIGLTGNPKPGALPILGVG
jgi:hypothetical protein